MQGLLSLDPGFKGGVALSQSTAFFLVGARLSRKFIVVTLVGGKTEVNPVFDDVGQKLAVLCFIGPGLYFSVLQFYEWGYSASVLNSGSVWLWVSQRVSNFSSACRASARACSQ